MAEPTLVCPQCKTEIKLTESLAAPLLESVKRRITNSVSRKKMPTCAKREQALIERAAIPRKSQSDPRPASRRKNSNRSASASPPKSSKRPSLLSATISTKKPKKSAPFKKF